jgi:hypothetical protein
MPVPTLLPAPATPAPSVARAVAWLEPGRAVIARGTGIDAPVVAVIALEGGEEAPAPALAAVARAIGTVERVVVIGPADLRLALEREIVAIGHRPDVIRDADVDGPIDTGVIVEELRRLA